VLTNPSRRLPASKHPCDFRSATKHPAE
jgi:hypothetical protein